MATDRYRAFQETVWRHFDLHGRHELPWRIPEANGGFDPYKILVSELMLQQTQVARVIPKYDEFLKIFPNVETLASAQVGKVLIAWSGLGYNRRAMYLWQTAQMVDEEFGGVFPNTVEDLVKLPGVGKNTAGAIMAYAYNKPAIFIETNIRTVYIYHFFKDQTQVSDTTIARLLEETSPKDKSREWYWALMDYGNYLKRTVGNVARTSSTYTKQSSFSGSKRQVRGQVLRALHSGPLRINDLAQTVSDDRLPIVLEDLAKEGLIKQTDDSYLLA